VVQEVLGSLLLPQQDFLHSQQGVAVGVEVEAVENDVDDADDDVVSPRRLHSRTMTVTFEGSLTSAKEGDMYQNKEHLSIPKIILNWRFIYGICILILSKFHYQLMHN
jgi:hypothetical protein